MKEKKPLSHEVVCFQKLDFKTSSSKSEVSKSNSWKITCSTFICTLRASLGARCFLFMGNAGAVGKLAALYAKEKTRTACTKTNYTHNAYPKTVSVKKKRQHTYRAQDRRKTDKFFKVSYFITTFNQNSIHEWE